MAVEDRRRITARVSDEAYDGWMEFCRDHGATVSALVEEVGLVLAQQEGRRLSEPWKRLAAHARARSGEMRRRD